jgi:F-type H+-transporting ATPase subunit b
MKSTFCNFEIRSLHFQTVGLATYLCSKTMYIMEHEFYVGLSIAIMGIYAVKKLGSGIAKFLDAEVPVR